MPDYQKHIVYLSEAQKEELFLNGSITVDGRTIVYSDSDLYLTPQAAPLTDVQVNGTSVVQNGVANVPYAEDLTHPGVVRVPSNAQRLTAGTGVHVNNGLLALTSANTANIKSGLSGSMAIVPSNQHESTFYGLAKAAGDSTQSASSNAVGAYTESAKSVIKGMLGVGEWVNVADITLTEETNSVSVTTDRKYYEVYVYIDIKPAASSTSLSFGVKNEAGNTIRNQFLGSQVDITEKKTLIRLESMPGMAVMSYNNDNSASQTRMSVDFNELTDYGIKTITVSAYSSIMFPVGSVIKIYAR